MLLRLGIGLVEVVGHEAGVPENSKYNQEGIRIILIKFAI